MLRSQMQIKVAQTKHSAASTKKWIETKHSTVTADM